MKKQNKFSFFSFSLQKHKKKKQKTMIIPLFEGF